MFARGLTGETLERHRVNGSWTDWSSIGGNSTSGPAAAPFGDSLFVFIRGTDGGLYYTIYANGTWSAWKTVDGYLTSAPAAALRRGTGDLDVAVRAGDNTIAVRSYNGSGWAPWGYRQGTATSAPALASYLEGRVSLFVRWTDGAIWGQDFDGTNVGSWASFSGDATSAPAVASRASGYENNYVRGPGNALYIRSWSSAAPWTDWALLDARPLDSGPAAAGDSADHEWVVARGGSGLLFKEWTTGGGWLPWQDLGPVALPAPPPPVTPGQPVVDIPAATGCTISGQRLRVRISLKQVEGRIASVTFFTKGKGATKRVDRRSPFDVRLKINRPAGSKGRVYARIAYRRSKHAKLKRKTVSGPYSVCR